MNAANYFTRDENGRAFTFYAVSAESAVAHYVKSFPSAKGVTATLESEAQAAAREAASPKFTHGYNHND